MAITLSESANLEQPDLLPARMVAEHAYCARLFYYMQVEGVFLPSSDTEQGQQVHRRVNKPSATSARSAFSKAARSVDSEPPTAGENGQQHSADTAEDEGDPDRPKPIRSLALTSDKLALTATLDLAEIAGEPFAGGVAVPVEYRKGRPRHIELDSDEEPDDEAEPGRAASARVEPWPPDRVQLGLQVLLLEEHGYRVPHAVLYYAAERRRVTVTVDDALRNDARRELDSARKTSAGSRPLPLLNDPKCPRCSLQPICLPDEIQHQRVAAQLSPSAATEPAPPRRLWPLRDDGIHIVAQTEGVRVGVRGASLRFTDRAGRLVREIPTASLESLAVVGNVQVSTQALCVLADQGVPIVYMTSAGRAVGWIDAPGPLSVRVRSAQFERLSQPDVRLDLARAIVCAKIANQRTLLMRNTPDLPRAIQQDLAVQAEASKTAPTIDALLGHEGQAAALYFREFPAMLRQPELANRFASQGRRRRPPPDPVNALLSFAYAMLVHESATACRTALLDPAVGAYHTPRAGRPALALDLMEPFRPLIADSVAISLINRGEVGPGHFLDTAAGCALTDAGRRAFFDAWGRRMATEVTHPVFEYRLSYRRMLMLHARLVAAWFAGEAPTLEFLTTR